MGDARRSRAGNIVGVDNGNINDGPTAPPALVPTAEGAVCVFPICRSSKTIESGSKAPFLDCCATLYLVAVVVACDFE